VLHCLPGDLAAKAVVFDNLNAFLGPAGVLFGAISLSGGVYANRAAWKLMHIYNAKGIFSNADDHLDALRGVLGETYAEEQIDVVGCVALFSARRPKRICLTKV
jgi:hypothetical protein